MPVSACGCCGSSSPDVRCSFCPGAGLNSYNKLQVTFSGITACACTNASTIGGLSYKVTGPSPDQSVCLTFVTDNGVYCLWQGTTASPLTYTYYSGLGCTGSVLGTLTLDTVQVYISNLATLGLKIQIQWLDSGLATGAQLFNYIDTVGTSTPCSNGSYSNVAACVTGAGSGGTAALVWAGCSGGGGGGGGFGFGMGFGF